MIIYIHGFGGSGQGSKARLFREQYKNVRFIAPSLPYVPDLAIMTLEELIEQFLKNEPVYLIGSSLGGFYALYLSDKYNLPTVLLNPSVKPYETLARLVGEAPSFYDESSFEWNEEHIKSLRGYDVQKPNEANIFLLAQSGDEVLDYREALQKLPNARRQIDEGGNHGFEGIEKHFEAIELFFRKQAKGS